MPNVICAYIYAHTLNFMESNLMLKVKHVFKCILKLQLFTDFFQWDFSKLILERLQQVKNNSTLYLNLMSPQTEFHICFSCGLFVSQVVEVDFVTEAL